MKSDRVAAGEAPRALCVYTTLTGGYEKLNEQPVSGASRIPFICLTDDARLQSESWQVRLVPTLFRMDPVRSQRALKLRPHEYLPEFDASLYVDNTVLLSEPPEALLAQFLPEPGFCLPAHSFRASVMDEFLEVIRDGLDDENRILEQLYHYALDCPGVLREKPYWTGLLLRDHRNPAVREVLDLWFSHVQRYSRRDQLSANVAFRRAGLTPQLLPIDNHTSRFHSWPHRASRSRAGQAPLTADSFGSPDPRIRDLEQRLAAMEGTVAEERRLRASLLSSTTWRATAPFRSIGDRFPGLARSVRRAAGTVSGRPVGHAVSAPTAIPQAVHPAGRSFHVAPGDERGRQLLLRGGDLNPPTLSIWRLLLAEGPWTHVVDVGANYGEMLLNIELPPGAQILAFEPNPHVLIQLVRNLLDAKIRAGIFAEAVSDRKGIAQLLVDRIWSGTSRLGERDPAGPDEALEPLDVPTTTLADELGAAVAASRVRALVKVDVEGHEVPVLAGLTKILGDLEEFAGLVEILHLSPADRGWLLDHFEVELFHLEANALVRVDPPTPDRLTGLLADSRFYPQDVVLRRKGSRADAAGSHTRSVPS